MSAESTDESPHIIRLDDPALANPLGEPTIESVETALSRAEDSDSPALVIRSDWTGSIDGLP